MKHSRDESVVSETLILTKCNQNSIYVVFSYPEELNRIKLVLKEVTCEMTT